MVDQIFQKTLTKPLNFIACIKQFREAFRCTLKITTKGDYQLARINRCRQLYIEIYEEQRNINGNLTCKPTSLKSNFSNIIFHAKHLPQLWPYENCDMILCLITREVKQRFISHLNLECLIFFLLQGIKDRYKGSWTVVLFSLFLLDDDNYAIFSKVQIFVVPRKKLQNEDE